MATSRRKKPRTQYHHGNLAEALVAEAIALTAEHGVEGWSMSQAASRLGVSSAAPYRHFENRAALLDAVALAGLQRLRDAICEAFDAHDELRAQYHAVAFAVVELAMDEPAHYAITFSSARPNTQAQLAMAGPTTAIGTLRDMIRTWQERGLLRAGDPQELAITMWAAGHGVASLIAGGRLAVADRREAKAICERTMESLLVGIGG